jgi:class 3 adenylate cyclase
VNILPQEVADELKKNGASAAREFDRTTILFTDFRASPRSPRRYPAAELVEELNVCFKAFDAIITAHGIEKIKTIGDAYMAAGGLSEPSTSAPVDVVRAALEMQEFCGCAGAERKAQGRTPFEMRVGIHTGPWWPASWA